MTQTACVKKEFSCIYASKGRGKRLWSNTANGSWDTLLAPAAHGSKDDWSRLAHCRRVGGHMMNWTIITFSPDSIQNLEKLANRVATPDYEIESHIMQLNNPKRSHEAHTHYPKKKPKRVDAFRAGFLFWGGFNQLGSDAGLEQPVKESSASSSVGFTFSGACS